MNIFRHKQVVTGLVDTRPFVPILGGSLVTGFGNPAQIGEEIRQQFWAGVTGTDFVVVPLNSPEDCYKLDPDYGEFLRVCDRVQVEVSKGRVTRVISANNLPITALRPSWAAMEDSPPDRPAITGKLGRILRVLGCGIGIGDIFTVSGAPGTGKTFFLREILKSLYANTIPVVILVGERQKEIPMFFSQELFAIPSTESPLRKIRGAELGLHRAMRLAELGNHVVVLLDSLTRFVDAISMLPTPNGLGIKAGGTNPVAVDAIQVAMGVARKPPVFRGSITFIGTILDRADAGDQLVIAQSRSTSTGQITLSSAASSERIYPPIDLAIEEIKIGGRTVTYRRSFSRTQDRWYALTPQARQLQSRLEANPVNGLRALLHRLDLPENKQDEDLFRSYGIEVPTRKPETGQSAGATQPQPPTPTYSLPGKKPLTAEEARRRLAGEGPRRSS